MQNLDIISVNLWQMLIALCNLVILFLILKKFLYKPVKKMLAQRQKAVDDQFAAADEARQKAEASEAEWTKRMEGVKAEADGIIARATETAAHRGDKLVEDARSKAESILRQAETAADLERRKAEADIKENIVDISSQLAGKMLEREINPDDHRRLIDSFIEEIGDDHDSKQ